MTTETAMLCLRCNTFAYNSKNLCDCGSVGVKVGYGELPLLFFTDLESCLPVTLYRTGNTIHRFLPMPSLRFGVAAYISIEDFLKRNNKYLEGV